MAREQGEGSYTPKYETHTHAHTHTSSPLSRKPALHSNVRRLLAHEQKSTSIQLLLMGNLTLPLPRRPSARQTQEASVIAARILSHGNTQKWHKSWGHLAHRPFSVSNEVGARGRENQLCLNLARTDMNGCCSNTCGRITTVEERFFFFLL